MAEDSDNDLSFAAMDALLDQALALDEHHRAKFIDALGTRQREALLKLLRNTEPESLSNITARAKKTISQVAQIENSTNASAGKWQLKKEIGSGGTGQVFYAERYDWADDSERSGDDDLVQRAAVKILWSHRVASEFRERFLRERRILASIDHPGLAKFLDGGLLGDGRPWFAMEYVQGEDIVCFAADCSIEERLWLFLAIADTIDYAHQRLIVHRDIKPLNVLVDALGQPRVLDFGIARILDEFDEQEITESQGTPVTLQYASPEQVTGGSIDVSSDVYQLGLLLYEMLAGEKPYEIHEASLQEAIDKICLEHPPPPSTYDRSIDSDLDAIVQKALRKQPGNRYPTAAAMADDIRRFMEGRTVSARPRSTFYAASRFVKRNLLPVSVIATSLVALTIATVFSVNRAYEAKAEAERSRTTQQILADVFEQADPFGDGGAEITLADALIKAKPSIDTKIANDPRLAWEVNKTLAEIFSSLDLLDQEQAAFQGAWDAAKQLGGDNEREVLFAIAGLGNILVRTDPTAGGEFLSQHLPEAPKSKDAAVEWLSAKYAQVSAYLRLRDYEGADQGARSMFQVAQTFDIDNPRTLGRIHQLLAGVARRGGDLPAADAHWIQSVSHMRRADVPAGLAVTLSNQALHYGMTDRFDESERAFRESIAIFREHAPDNTSHANVLRLYAGLLFRTRRPAEALSTLDEALLILDPSKQSYAFFVAQLNRANYAFASDRPEIAMDGIFQGLDVALPAFGKDSEVTKRIYPVFARLLIFAGREGDAARVLGVSYEQWCREDGFTVQDLDESVRQLANTPKLEQSRETIWKEIRRLQDSAKTGQLESEAYLTALHGFKSQADVFLDILDRHQILSAFDSLASSTSFDSSAIEDQLSDLIGLQQATRLAMDEQQGERLTRLLEIIRPDFVEGCDTNASPPVVSRPFSRLVLYDQE